MSFAVTVGVPVGDRAARSPARAPARVLAAALFALNPNVLYLQSTPMTEPLLFALTSLVVLHLTEWVDVATRRGAAGGGLDDRRRVPDALRSLADRRRGDGAGGVRASGGAGTAAARAVVRELRGSPSIRSAPCVFFMVMSRVTTGEWFVTGGFYVPDPEAAGPAAAVVGRDPSRAPTISAARALVVAAAIAAIALAGRSRR